MTNLPEYLSFEDINLSIIDHNGKPWLTAADLARALGYKNSRAVSSVYDRNKEEFTLGMSLVLNLSTRGAVAPKPVRVFSTRGCHLIGMFSKTEKAKAFRKWVLDVLEGLVESTPDGPAIQDELNDIIKRHRVMRANQDDEKCKAANQMIGHMGFVEPMALVPVAELNAARAAFKRIEELSGLRLT